MKSLLACLDERKTVQIVKEHLLSFSKISHLYSIEEVENGEYVSISTKNFPQTGVFIENRVLRKVCRSESVNRITKQYLERMIKAINGLNEYNRSILIMKYFYMMDDEEMSDCFHVSIRKVQKDLHDAKIALAFLLGCEQYK